jgi:hypothetical protein
VTIEELARIAAWRRPRDHNPARLRPRHGPRPGLARTSPIRGRRRVRRRVRPSRRPASPHGPSERLAPERGERTDRHEHVGGGNIGERGLGHVVRHPALRHVPFICETPGMDWATTRSTSPASALSRREPLDTPESAFEVRAAAIGPRRRTDERPDPAGPATAPDSRALGQTVRRQAGVVVAPDELTVRRTTVISPIEPGIASRRVTRILASPGPRLALGASCDRGAHPPAGAHAGPKSTATGPRRPHAPAFTRDGVLLLGR